MSMAELFSEFEVSTLSELTRFEHSLSSRLAVLSADLAKELVRTERAWSERLNQTARRLRMAETEREWRAILIETASRMCQKVDVFFTSEEAIASAPAFATAIETKDTVVTLRDASQLSEKAIETLGEAISTRCHLFPILDGESVPAVLYAEHPVPIDRQVLELLATIAAGTMPRPVAAEPETIPSPALIQIGGVAAPKSAPNNNARVPVTEFDRAIHLAAQRFARVEVAKIILDHHHLISFGRRNRTLYVTLKEPIDSGRRRFRIDYVEKCPSMADYYHEELVRTLAQHDSTQLGTEYPGAMV
jgi:hypothetical protein